MRIVTGAIRHETNTFSNVPTTLEHYRRSRLSGGILLGQDIPGYFGRLRTPTTAFYNVAEEEGWEMVPTVWAECEPAGPVTREAFDFLLGEFLTRLHAADPVDAVLLDLHGAMVLEDEEDGDGALLAAIRGEVGDEVPIVATLDWHANITHLMVDKADVLVGYDTYPHLDTYDRGLEAAHILRQMLRGELHPVMALGQPPLLVALASQFTGAYPMSALIDRAYEMEREEGVISVTVAGGFPYADTRETGLAFVVVTDGDERLAGDRAGELVKAALEVREATVFKGVSIADAVAQAVQVSEGPIVLADGSDNMGSGCPTDGTVLLRALLDAGVKGAVVAAIADPEAVAQAMAAGIGSTVTLAVGGRTDHKHGDPINLKGRVSVISDGRFVNKGPWGKGAKVDMGPTVVFDCDGVEVVITQRRIQPSDPEAFRSLGIEPLDRRVLVVKSAVNFRAAFQPIARQILEVETPGIGSPLLHTFDYRRVRRPIFPLDPLPD
jgi:microcystin degradation protein MlrC